MTPEEYVAMVEEENKNLRAYADNLDSENDNQAIEIEELKKENKKLKKYYDRDKEELMESCYSLARENEQLKLHVEAKDKAYMSLLTDYNYLQARIKRMEKKFLEYVENHKKLEDELDDVIMNR